MKKLLAATEFQYKSNGQEYHKVYVQRANGTMVSGSRTLNAFTGKKLQRVVKEMQQDIDSGAYDNR